jgi:hypothetical protein
VVQFTVYAIHAHLVLVVSQHLTESSKAQPNRCMLQQ